MVTFSRINLAKTNYQEIPHKIITEPDYHALQTIYYDYTVHKGFESCMPIQNEEFDEGIIFGYYDNNELVAFTMASLLNDENTYSDQFAWNYNNPKLRLGIRSIQNECAVLKKMGVKYYYLGEHNDYKAQFDGYEICGKLQRP